MTNKPMITTTQLLFMSVGSALVFPYTFMPILRTPPANQDVWVVLLLMFVYVLIINAPILFLINRFRGMNINEMVETILGKYLGKVAAIIFVLFFLYCFAACSLITAVFISLYIFPDTPTWALLLYMVVPVIYAAYKGAGTIGRLSTFVVPFIMFTIIVFFVMGIDNMDINVLKPVLADSTFLELNQGAFLTASRYSEILIFLVFSFFLKKKANVNKTYLSALITFGICFFMILIPTLLTLGVDLAKHEWNPYFAYTRQVEGYDFIERIHSLNTLAWFPVTLLKLIMYNFMGSYVLAGVVKAKSHQYFVVPLSVITFIVCLLPIMNKSSTIELLRSDRVFPFIVLPIILVLPVILVVVYFIRRKTIDPILRKNREADAASE